jgi:hypothetical protein
MIVTVMHIPEGTFRLFLVVLPARSAVCCDMCFTDFKLLAKVLVQVIVQ